MKNKILFASALSLMLIILAACTKSGDCVIEYACESGYESSTTVFDIEEGECIDLAADFESSGECTVNYEWIAE